MRAKEHIRKILNDTGLYRLTGESPGDWEGNACGAGFDLLDGQIQDLLEALSPVNMPEEWLDLWESLFRPQASEGTPEERREMIAHLLAACPEAPNRENLGELIRAAGVRGAVRETEDGLEIFLSRLTGVPEEEALRELSRLLPAHMAWELVRQPAWSVLDDRPRTFAEWDELGLTWAQLDGRTWADWTQTEN